MIKFFRKIRQNLLLEGKSGKYFKYAIGEIILVVIGILIALQVNNWNQELIGNRKERDLLKALKEELHLNISILSKNDSAFILLEKDCEEGMKILKQASNVKMILKADSLVQPRYVSFWVNRGPYDEMLSSGRFYSLNNKSIQEAIRKHYVDADNYVRTYQELNATAQDIEFNNEELYIVEVLKDRMNDQYPTLKGLDTTWITNQNSPQYLCFYRKSKFFKDSNGLKKRILNRFKESCEELAKKIETEISK